MLPVLVDLKFMKIYTSGIFMVLAFFWGSFLLWKLIRLTSFKEEDIFDGLFTALAGALFFGRLFYVMLNFKEFGFSFLKFILVNGFPGFSLYGSLLGGYIVLWLYLFFKKIDFREVVDYWMSPLFTALAFGKLGSFFAGSEPGMKTKFFLSVKYVGVDGARHLTPLYEALIFFLGAYICYRCIFEIRKGNYSKGFNFYFSLWYFSLVYFLFDKLKANHLYFLRWNFNRVVSLILFLTLTSYFLYYFKDLIAAKSSMIINSTIEYGHKNYKKIAEGIRRRTQKRSNQASRSDRTA